MGKIIKTGFTNSKVTSHSSSGGKGLIGLGGFGTNTHKLNHGFKSKTKGVKMNGK